MTQLEKKEEGVDKDIDELRGILNKLTSKNYDTMKANIIQTLTKMFEKNCNEEDLEKIGESIFEIGSVNKFWSALYAKLYKDLIKHFEIMKKHWITRTMYGIKELPIKKEPNIESPPSIDEK